LHIQVPSYVLPFLKALNSVFLLLLIKHAFDLKSSLVPFDTSPAES